ncbi:hypothetical protein [Roseateles sp. P5_E7]
MSHVSKFALLLALLAAAFVSQARPLFGFTPFPYDATAQALGRVAELLQDNATVHALHFDDGLPWEEVMDGKPLPKKVQNDWDDALRAVPRGRPVYLGLTPLAKDRKSLAPGRTDKDVPLPWSLKFASLDDDKVKAAYLEYARRAVRQFKPAYLNLGIEAGELANREPKRWPQFEALYRHVATALKREFPQMQIGISFGLQSLRKPEVAQRVKALVDASDYIGLSFYPHASPFGERFGEPALGDGEEAWREPLNWLRSYTSKPIAICETGYLTRTINMPKNKLTMKGDPGLQARYVKELAQFAERDQYLFVVWFLAVDYDRLYERMGGDKPDNEVNLMWRNIGLWDGDVKPKPALEEWKRALGGRVESAPVASAAPALPARVPATKAAFDVGFSSEQQLFQAGGGSRMELKPDGVAQWSFENRHRDFVWALRELGTTLPATTARMTLRLRSNRPGAIFVQLEEKGGETFFAMVEPGSDWADLSIDLASFKPDPAKRRDGVLQVDQISKLLIADQGGRDRPEGRREVWLSRWRFE